jgi:cytochrome c oxidase subunit II
MTRPPMRRAAALSCLAALTTGCVPEAATAQGRDVAWLYNVFMLASAGVFVIVIGLLIWSIIRYRGQPGRDVEMPAPTRGNMTLELIWWSLPAALVVVLAVLTVGVLGQVDARADEPQVVVEVQGFQWGWQFTFPDADVVVSGTAADPPRIELPMGETIAFEITSQDVVHSFWIPRFLIKRDAIPNRPNRFDVVIEEAGTYGGQCGEFCGLLHSRQLFEIDAVSRDQFDAWLAAQRSEEADR